MNATKRKTLGLRPGRRDLFLTAWILASAPAFAAQGGLEQQAAALPQVGQQPRVQAPGHVRAHTGDVYVVNNVSHDVSVIGGRTNTVVATIPVGQSPYDVAITPDGDRAYVTNYNSGTVSVINTRTRAVVDTIVVGTQAYRIKLNPSGSTIYVTHSNPGSVSVIDRATHAVTASIPLSSFANDLALTPDGARVYVASAETNTIFVIDTATQSIIDAIPVGSRPFGLAMAPDGSSLYATADFSTAVTVISTATNTITSTIALGPIATDLPFGITITPDGSELYVTVPNEIVFLGVISAVFADAEVIVVDIATQTVTNSLFVQTRPHRAASQGNGRHVFVTNRDAGTVSIIDSVTHAVAATIPVGTAPRGIAIVPAE